MIRPAMTSRHLYDSHPSISASMDDFEINQREFSPTVPDIPSQHSGFRSNTSEYSEHSSRRSDSPPAWRKAGSGWFAHHQSLSPSRRGYASKEPSPEYHSAEDDDDLGDGEVTAYPIPSRIPLPESPLKGRSVEPTPEPDFGGGAGERDRGGGGRVNARSQRPTTPMNNAPREDANDATPTQMNCK